MVGKFLLVLTCVICYTEATSISKDTINTITAKLTEVGEKCLEQAGAKPEDINVLIKDNLPTTKEQKCLVACALKETGLTVENGELTDKFGLSEIVKKEDPEFLKSKTKISEECRTEVAPLDDECEYASKLYECNIKKSKEAGIPTALIS